MRLTYKIGLYITGTMLIFCLLIACSYVDYKNSNNSNSSIVLVEDGLSINYIDGNEISFNGKEKVYTFSVTNNSEDSIYYYIKIHDIDSNKDSVDFSLVEKSNILTEDKKNLSNREDYVASLINIGEGETHTYELTILESKHTNLKASIEIGLEDSSDDNFATILLNNNDVKTSATTKIGEEVATENEGLIQLTEDNGNSYYFRGNIENNYVSYANLLWRIVKINSDGSVKLILNDYITDNGNFYNSGSSDSITDKLNFDSSNIYSTLESWYQTNLGDYESNIASSKYCTDDSVSQTSDANTYYLGYTRLLSDYYQTESCLGTEVTSKIGLLTADEAVIAGASKNGENTSFYLYTAGKDLSWWTMTPASSDNDNIVYFEISQNGLLKNESAGSFYRGIKPVINLIKKTYVDGEGTSTDPYVVK